MSIGNSEIDSSFTLVPKLTSKSAFFLLIKNAGLPMSNLALKNVLLTLKVICIHLVFPVADLMTSSLTESSGFCN